MRESVGGLIGVSTSSGLFSGLSVMLVVFADAGVTIGLIIAGINAAAAVLAAYAALRVSRRASKPDPPPSRRRRDRGAA